MRRIMFLLLLLTLSTGLITGCGQGQGVLKVQDAWARPAKAGETSAIYFTINNEVNQPDVLLDVKCDAAMMAQVHNTTIDSSGKASMEHQASLAIPARQQVAFKPGGLHVMLMNLKNDLKTGDKVPFTLIFEKGGSVQLEAAVRVP